MKKLLFTMLLLSNIVNAKDFWCYCQKHGHTIGDKGYCQVKGKLVPVVKFNTSKDIVYFYNNSAIDQCFDEEKAFLNAK